MRNSEAAKRTDSQLPLICNQGVTGSNPVAGTIACAPGPARRVLEAIVAAPPRRPVGSVEQAERAFKALTAKPVENASPRPTSVPAGKETVSLRLDRDVLAHFQDDGPGLQDRINDALRKAAGI
jgi:uncharacterized protein (DUF4415 family)